MSETKHTPGPWDDASNYPESHSVRIFSKCHYIATVGNSDDTKEQTEANARLIAAAPDLLVDLESCVAFLLQPSEARPLARHAAIQKALVDIAKAKGQS